MRRREFIAGIGGAAAWPLVACAQQPKLPTVGLLNGVSFEGPYAAPVIAIRQGLQEAGLVEGQNLAVEYRTANGAYERLPDLAADPAHRRVAVIIAIGAPRVALAATAAASTVPIVFATGSDAVEVGVVDSLNRPEANATGASLATAGPAARRLELLLDLRPGASSLVGYLDNSCASQAFEANVENVTGAARIKGRELAVFDAGTEREVETAFIGMALRRIRALVVAADAFLITRQEQIIELAAEQRLPTIYATRGAVLRGGLMSYGALTRDMYRSAGVYAGRILNSTTSAALPVMPPARFAFVINKTTANALRNTVPKQLLARADEIVG
jgi:putative tryptophan/tyrosine transport system substrate-binding protein